MPTVNERAHMTDLSIAYEFCVALHQRLVESLTDLENVRRVVERLRAVARKSSLAGAMLTWAHFFA